MALFNVMVLNSNLYPVVTAIGDCTGHLSKDGKKDALFIAGVFSGLLLDFDAEANCVDIFYFDGALNVQKAGAVVEARFPRTVTYHGGKHSVALWFSDLAKIPEIKVCFLFMFQFIFVPALTRILLFLETHFEGVLLLQCRVLLRGPSFVGNYCCVRHEGLWRQAHPAARCRKSHGVFFTQCFSVTSEVCSHHDRPLPRVWKARS